MSKATYNFSILTRRAILANPPSAIARATAAALSAVIFVSTDNGQRANAERFTATA